MKWMPIETAPKDGTRILIWAGLNDQAVCVGSNPDGLIKLYQPTHWMPLPEPPQEKADETE